MAKTEEQPTEQQLFLFGAALTEDLDPTEKLDEDLRDCLAEMMPIERVRAAAAAVAITRDKTNSPKKDKPAKSKKRFADNRYSSLAGADLSDEDYAFAKALREKLGPGVDPTPGETIDVLMDMGYTHPDQKDFRGRILQLHAEIESVKQRSGTKFPERSAFLAAAKRCGWSL